MATADFDLRALLESIDAQRRRQDLSWAALSSQVGVSTSTIRRFGVAADAEADGVLALLRWLGEAPETFVKGGRVRGRRLSTETEGYIRVDMQAIAAASGTSIAPGRSRTTIQRLVRAADQAGQPVMSFTKLSET